MHGLSVAGCARVEGDEEEDDDDDIDDLENEEDFDDKQDLKTTMSHEVMFNFNGGGFVQTLH